MSMAPHPTTMQFAYEKEVHRSAGTILATMILAFFAMFGSSFLANGASRMAAAAAEGNPLLASALGLPSPVEFVWETKGGPGFPLDPINPAVDPQGNLWVPDGRNHRFQIFAPDGTFLEVWGEPGSGVGQFDFVDPTISEGNGQASAEFDADGNLYVVDTGNRRIQKFGPDRVFVAAWGGEGRADGQFLAPVDLTIDKQGHVLVADGVRNDVQVFSADGEFLDAWSANAYGGISNAPDGDVWVADWYENLVERHAPDGTLRATWAAAGFADGKLTRPSDVAVDAQGRVYVADFGNNRIQVFAPDGQYLTQWGETGFNEGEFLSPTSLLLDGEGNVYVAEESGDRVQKFRLLPPLAK
jgi:tripartite motif-containing protein 71